MRRSVRSRPSPSSPFRRSGSTRPSRCAFARTSPTRPGMRRAHRPVGQINEIRKAVYLASSKLRHQTNAAPQAEPTGGEHFGFNMRLSREELTANIDNDFKAVLAQLQHTFNLMAEKRQHGRATHTFG